MYAIVDIETTGGQADSNGITEIAIYVFDGKKITDEYTSLVNPGVLIPSFLESYTGITNQMVKKSPSFAAIASKVYDMLKDNIFIAHNVNFDYSFIQHQLLQSGFNLNTQKLCTVRLSRKVFPGHKSYSLGNICTALGIPISNRHRAAGDALATVKLFAKIQANDTESIIPGSLKKDAKKYLLPPNLPKEQFNQLPSQIGVYYFNDSHGKIVYVGKASNIKKKVGSYFINNKNNKQKQNLLNSIYSISFMVCATELMAFILESVTLKKHVPEFNSSPKISAFNFGIYDYEDRNNYKRLVIDKVRKNMQPLLSFKTQIEAMKTMQELVDNFNLCPKLCGFNSSNEACTIVKKGKGCFGVCQQKETADIYNKRVTESINWLTTHKSYAIFDKGLYADEASCILIENGKFYGMGYLPIDQQITNIDFIKSFITPNKDNFYVNDVLFNMEKFVLSAKIVKF